MSEVTDGDREKARDLARDLLNGILTPSDMADPIAAALAQERQKARMPFLALAEELEAWAVENDGMEPTNTDGLLRSITAGRVTRRIAHDIRRAAEDG